ncbi:MAG: carotenoid biosynthesis protein [Bryobacteraceae bacterium]
MYWLRSNSTSLALWALLACYAAARVLQAFAGAVPIRVIVLFHVLPPALFALIHGAMRYRLWGIAAFTAICLLVGNGFENLSILTGFPFGHYYFTDLMGPRVFHVPILLGLAYVGMGYLSWTLGCLTISGARGIIAGARLVTVPVTAAFVMVAWDLSMDPVWSTIMHCWIWLHGGVYFGVPVSNFLGWYLTVYVIYQSFALYLWERPTDRRPLPSGYWRMAILFYGVSAAGNLALIPRAGLSFVSDPAGARWRVGSIVAASALVSIFVMGAFALFAWKRLGVQEVSPSR